MIHYISYVVATAVASSAAFQRTSRSTAAVADVANTVQRSCCTTVVVFTVASAVGDYCCCGCAEVTDRVWTGNTEVELPEAQRMLDPNSSHWKKDQTPMLGRDTS